MALTQENEPVPKRIQTYQEPEAFEGFGMTDEEFEYILDNTN